MNTDIEHLPMPDGVQDCGGLCHVCIEAQFNATISRNTATAINRNKTAEQLLKEVAE